MPYACRGVLVAVLLSAPLLHANCIIDFEAFPDSTPILDNSALADQFPGLLFSNVTVISAGISLNEFEFPPQSGNNVAFDQGGPVFISFLQPITTFAAYLTYTVPVFLAAYDSTGAEVSVTPSLYSSNLALSGDPGSLPNELLQVAYGEGISRVSIMGDPNGASFTVDDISFDNYAGFAYAGIEATEAPEPGTLAFLLIGCVLAGLRKLPR